MAQPNITEVAADMGVAALFKEKYSRFVYPILGCFFRIHQL